MWNGGSDSSDGDSEVSTLAHTRGHRGRGRGQRRPHRGRGNTGGRGGEQGNRGGRGNGGEQGNRGGHGNRGRRDSRGEHGNRGDRGHGNRGRGSGRGNRSGSRFSNNGSDDEDSVHNTNRTARGSNRGSRGRGGTGNREGGKHWKQRFGFTKLTELKNELPSNIVLECSANSELLIDALNCTEHSDEMIELFLVCLSKAVEYTGLRQKVLDILTLLMDCEFLKSTLLKFFTKLLPLSEEDLANYETSLSYILIICSEIKSKLPNSLFQIMGITAMLKIIIARLSNSRRPTAMELAQALVHLESSNENALEHFKTVKPTQNREERDCDLPPPQDFHEIPVFPEEHDIHVDVQPYLRKNKTKGRYDNLYHYLDVQFRLLREDFVGPLRDGIQDYIMSLKKPKDKWGKSKDIRVYTDVQIISSVCNSSGLCRRVTFSCPGFKRIRWESSKRLLFGSLVCLSVDNFDSLLFAIVGNRDIKDLKKGLVDLKFENQHEISAIPEGTVFIMAESSAFFEAYRHVLTGLKTLKQGDLPFERYIVSCETDVDTPAYINHRATFDLRPLVDDDIIIRDKSRSILRDRELTYIFSNESQRANNIVISRLRYWPSPQLLHLDESQYSAVQLALTKEFVIIQGPPGTGKTYIGLKIVKSLLHNQIKWNPDADDRSPLLVVCYTNHALDQFLEGILKFYQGDVLRLGSRSSSEIMKQHNINSKRLALRRDRKAPIALFRERIKARVHMNALKEAINKISKRIEDARREVLHEETLQAVIDYRIWDQLLAGHQLLLQQMVAFGIKPPKGRKRCALLEWLGYGDLTCGQQPLQLPSVSTTSTVLADDDNDDEEDDDDEFIDADDEANAQMQQRLMDIYDDDFDDIDDDGAIAEITTLLENIGLTKDTIALDVSNIGKKQSVDADGWQIDAKQRKKIKRTLRKELISNDKMALREMQRIRNVWKIEQKDRWRLYRYWVHQYCERLHDQIGEREEEFQDACDHVNEMQMQEDKEIMRHASVIGLTTTCAARYQSVLKEIGPKIVVVEEAAEVLEAHVITTLSRRCQHLILIGDHQQLKPNPTVYKLAKHFNLDISLFERLINNNLDYRCLALQHRMRPEISKIMKTIYPELQDHDSVKTYEAVKGVSKNAFFIDHTELESSDDDIKSHCNIHEADYLVALCRYLLLQGYKPEQITVLTLYSAQLFELKRRMPKTNFNGVKLTVVDNYQGEENDIILLSLVRSNTRNNLGFVGIENRICVALSRAKKGLFVIGNFCMLEKEKKNDLWKKIVALAREENMIGKSLSLYCQNHPRDKGIEASSAEDFRKAPEGGCLKPCEKQLKCGHACTRACHTYDKDHKEFVCKKPCRRVLCELGHQCPGICSKKCKPCKVPISKIIPKCGHVQMVPCSQDPSTWSCQDKCKSTLLCGHPCQNPCGSEHTENCQAIVKKKWPCGHSANMHCYRVSTAKCPMPCSQILDCEHKCDGTCGECLRGRLHKACKRPCKRPLICEHLCQDRCSNCPPCTRQCQNRCVHSSCQKFCGDLCIPCKEPCEWQCRHYRCKEMCGEPCKRPRCNLPCMKALKCGHGCIGLCGEPCPTACRVCDKDSVKEIMFGTEDEEDARFVQLQDCNHFFEVSGLDKWMDENVESVNGKSGIKLKECPRCKTPIRRNLRYGNMIKQALKDIENVKKQIIGNGKRIEELEKSTYKGMMSLSTGHALILKKHMENMMQSGPVSEQNFATIDNQVNFLASLKGLTDKYSRETDAAIILRFKSIEYGVYIKQLQEFILQERKYFTDQEISDILQELDRLKLLMKYIKIRAQQKKLGKKLEEKVEKVVSTAKLYLTYGTKLRQNQKKFVEEVLQIMRKLVPTTGLGISDEERVQIVKAMDLSKGHWYKCPKGHVYAIGDCGGATLESVCPECKSRIGGSSHRLRDDNALATEMDGATHSAWSEQAHMGNYDPFEIRF